MLGQNETRLLTAYVDGELRPGDREVVQRLLRQSKTARRLLERLRADAEALRALPDPEPFDFRAPVLDLIRTRCLRPAQQRRVAASTWVQVVAAASILLAVGAAIFFMSGDDLKNEDQTPPLARRHRGESKPSDEMGPVVKDRVADKNKPSDPINDSEPPRAIAKHGSTEKATLGQGKAGHPEIVVTAPDIGIKDAVVADVFIPWLLRVHDLHEEKSREALEAELSRHPAVYIELLAKDANRAFKWLTNGGKGQKFQTVIDELVRQNLAHKNPGRADFVLFIENMTPSELIALLDHVRKQDVQVIKKNRSNAQFFDVDPNLIVTRLTADHRKRLFALTGSELRPVVVPEAKKQGRPQVDIRKPFAEQTLAAVERALDDRARTSLAGGVSALALLYNFNLSRTGSVDVKRFRETRQPLKDGGIQVMLVLRTK